MTGTGIEMIKMFEGLRTKPYQDQVGVWTVGYGHTGNDIPGEITVEKANQLLEEDIKKVEDALAYLKLPVTNYQMDAIVSLAFNVGVVAVKNSTLMKRILTVDDDAFKEFRRWVYAGGQRVNGLYRRRMVESLRYLGADMEMLHYVWQYGA